MKIIWNKCKTLNLAKERSILISLGYLHKRENVVHFWIDFLINVKRNICRYLNASSRLKDAVASQDVVDHCTSCFANQHFKQSLEDIGRLNPFNCIAHPLCASFFAWLARPWARARSELDSLRKILLYFIYLNLKNFSLFNFEVFPVDSLFQSDFRRFTGTVRTLDLLIISLVSFSGQF